MKKLTQMFVEKMEKGLSALTEGGLSSPPVNATRADWKVRTPLARGLPALTRNSQLETGNWKLETNH